MQKPPAHTVPPLEKLETNLWALHSLALDQHAIVAITDLQGKITYVNDLFCDISGYSREELIGNTHRLVNSGCHETSFFREMFKTIHEKGIWRGEICNRRKDGDLYWVETTIATLKNNENEAKGYIAMRTDVTEQHRTLEAMRRLHEITISTEMPLKEKIDQILELGCEIFHLPIGIVSFIKDNTYTVTHSCTPTGEINDGDSFPLGDTYCSDIVQTKHAISHHHVGQSSFSSHPAYKNFALEAYIGSPINSEDTVIGTINFSGPFPRARAFGSAELELIQLFSKWISDEYSRSEINAELERQRLLLNAVSAQARIGAWEINVKTNEIYWSEVTREIHEVSDSFVPNMENAIKFYRDDEARETISKLINDSISAGQSWSIELPLITAKGNDIWVLARGEAVFQGNECIKLFGSFQDITQERKDKALQLTQAQRHQLMVESTAVGFWDVNIRTEQAILSQRWAEIIGYQLSEIEPVTINTWMDHCHPDDLVESAKKIEAYLAGETENYDCEARMKHKDGHWVWVHDTGRIVERDENGQPLRMIGTRIDITETRKAQAELHLSNQRIRLATESAGISIWEYNIETGEVFWDQNMYNLYGLEQNNEIGLNNWEQLFHPEDFEWVSSIIKNALLNKESFDLECRIIRPDKQVRHIRLAAAIITNELGHAQLMVGINIDISEQNFNASALLNAKKEAEAATRAKSDFLATMSHEIRTPMNGVLGMLSLLKNTELTEDQFNRVRIAQNSAQSLLSLINDILDFSKIEADKLQLESINFDLNETLINCVESLSNMADSKGLEIIIDTRLLIEPKVKGDPSRFKQILNNLISNAIKFTSNGEVIVSLKQVRQDDHWNITITVSDSGIGISSEKLPNLFEAFNQLDSSTTREYGGTGLGLAIVNNLCSRMGGSISVESEINKGSTFTADIQINFSDQESTERLSLAGKNILIIENNNKAREHLGSHLTELGAKVLLTKNGQEAIDTVSTTEIFFDVMLLDNNIPGEQWRDTAATLARFKSLDTAIRLLLVPVSFRVSDRFIESGAIHARIFKPIDVINLANNISDPNYFTTNSESEDVATRSMAFNGRRILLVEDNRVNQMVAEEMLTTQGIHVDIAENGQVALDILSSEKAHYDLVLMDCQMPILDGYDTTRAIRSGKAGPQNQSLPIIAMTAHAMNGDKERCLASGMNDYLSKPVDPKHMLDMLSLWILPNNSQDLAQNIPKKIVTESEPNSLLQGIWDKEKALSRVVGNEPLLHQLVDIFCNEQPVRLQEMRLALKEENFESLREQAHCLKGVAGNLGLDAIQDIAAKLDQDIRADDLGNCRQRLEDLYIQTERFVTTFNKINKKNTNGDIRNLRHELLSISNALDQNNYISQKSLDFMLKTYEDPVVEEQLTQLAREVTSFENEKAQARLNILLNQLNGHTND